MSLAGCQCSYMVPESFCIDAAICQDPKGHSYHLWVARPGCLPGLGAVPLEIQPSYSHCATLTN